jgi:hypothetical protein
MATARAISMMRLWKAIGWTEDVTYRPGRSGAPASGTITVIVDRTCGEAMPHGTGDRMQVVAINGEPEGISSALADIEKDRVMIAPRLGGTPIARGLGRIVSQDADFITLELA